jgi:dienelactone hydrolase
MVDGEFLYQGYLYDDHGGRGAVDPQDAYVQKFNFAAKAGTLTYPSDPAFVGNAADLVELRVRPTSDATALRVTLNSLVDPRRTAFTVAIGSSPAAVAWPNGAGVSSPAAFFLTVHGSTAHLTRAGSGENLAPEPEVVVDVARRQYDVRIPHAAWDPGSAKVRLAAGVGLWDVAAGSYLAPGAAASATAPGGASPSGEALFDLAFRAAEPTPDWTRMGLSATLADAVVVEQADQHCFWRECAQADALTTGDVSSFHADVDFGALQRKATDLRSVPTTGSIDRILASHFSFAQGVDATKACGRFPVKCQGMFPGNLQPYNVYVPKKRVPEAGWGLTLALHGSTGNYNEFQGSRAQTQLGDRGAGSIVVTSLSRDPSGDYTDAGEADVFETWADAARVYPVDATRTAITGYSMGGGGTYKLIERWPDLFGRGLAAAAVPYDHGFQGQWMTSMRTVPLRVWISLGDEGSPVLYQNEQIPRLQGYGLRFAFDQFLEGDHVTLATNDEWGPAVAWLGDAKVADDPARVTFAVDPHNDFPKVGVVADHAFWLSGMRARLTAAPPPAGPVDPSLVTGGIDPGAVSGGPGGVVDARSFGFGLADPVVLPPASAPSANVLIGGNHGPMPYLETTQDWAPPKRVAPADRLTFNATNLATVTVDIARARLTCDATLVVTTDGPLQIRLPGCGKTLEFGKGTTTRQISAG